MLRAQVLEQHQHGVHSKIEGVYRTEILAFYTRQTNRTHQRIVLVRSY